MKKTKIFAKALDWMQSETGIRLALLTGSHVDGSNVDHLSDYDIALFCRDPAEFALDEEFLEKISPVLVSIPESLVFDGRRFPTRLVIFSNGEKIDFSFFSMGYLSLFCGEQLPDTFDLGYEVLLDKDYLSGSITKPKHKAFREVPPSEEEFHALLKEFWFEVYHVAKYLFREDLWSAQSRFSGIHHQILIKMICWHASSQHQWDYVTHINGKNLHKWASNAILNELSEAFPHFSLADSWKSLSKAAALFRSLSHELAKDLGYRCLWDLEQYMISFVASLAIEKGAVFSSS